jgi:hypothetical protein
MQRSIHKIAVAASAAGAALLGGIYADQRYGFSYDINQLMSESSFRKRLGKWIGTLGNDVSLYHMMELAAPDAEALWFEGRSWSFKELLLGK